MKSYRFLPLICLGLFASGCGSKSDSVSNSASNNVSAQTDAGTITIISPHGREIQTEFTALWKAKNPHTEIKWLSEGGTSDDLTYVRNQYSTGSKEKGIGIDLFFGGGGETFTQLESDGLLSPLDSDYGVPAQLNGVPMRGKNNDWVAAALSGFGILYNKTIAARDHLPLPTSWEGLTDPKLRDRIGLADPRHSGSAHTAYEIILQSNGWDKGWKILTALAGNARSFSDSSGAPLMDVQNGEVVFCPAIDFFAHTAIKTAGAAKLGYIEPKGQYVVTPDPIALLPGAPHAAMAKKFVQMVMSKEGQSLWFLPVGSHGGPKTSELFRMPALPSVYEPIPANANVKSDPYANKNASQYDSDKAAKRREALDELIGAVLVDNHDAVKEAWQKNPNLDATGFVPISEADFMKVAAQWDKPEIAAAKKDEWANASRNKFN